MKFSEKVRDNLERFKDRIEKIGKKAIILGAIGASIGCASNGINGSVDNHVFTDAEFYDIYYKVSLMAKADSIYAGCVTKEDSIKAANEAWVKETGSNDPEVWWRIYNNPGSVEQGMRRRMLREVTSQYLPEPLYAPFIYFQYLLDESKK